VSPVKYELGFYIPDDDILHSHRRENLKSTRFNPFIALVSRLSARSLRSAVPDILGSDYSRGKIVPQYSVSALPCAHGHLEYADPLSRELCH
jgi:hypothetical protein